MGRAAHNKNAVNMAVAYVIPILMVGALVFATWVFCALVCVDYLLREQHRKGTAVCLITLYITVFLPLLAAYLRVVYTINTNPGYIPLGPKITEKKDEEEKDGRRGSHPENCILSQDSGENPAIPSMPHGSETPPQTPHVPNPPSLLETGEWQQHNRESAILQMPIPYDGRCYDCGFSRPTSFYQSEGPKNLSDFYNFDAFICESDGLPKWCPHCNCWKPDRSHHCREVERCVMKMDHFCPWVGGVVGETTFKFFYQVVVYGTIYCAFLLTATAVMLKDHMIKKGHFPGTWAAAITLAAIFGLFSAGMAITTTQLIWRNTSTIDNLSATTKVYQIAIYDPLGMQLREPVLSQRQGGEEQRETETSPLPSPHSPSIPKKSYQPNLHLAKIRQEEHHQRPSLPPRQSWASPPITSPTHKRITFPFEDPAYVEFKIQNQQSSTMPTITPRAFVIAKTQPGENPWQSPTVWENFAEVLGYRFWEWWVPMRPSPCSFRHDCNKLPDGDNGDLENGRRPRTTGWYRWNEELLARLRRECGIRPPWEGGMNGSGNWLDEGTKRKRRRRAQKGEERERGRGKEENGDRGENRNGNEGIKSRRDKNRIRRNADNDDDS